MLRYLSDYKRESVLAPLFKMLEATFDLFVPLVMADIVNVGIAAHDFHYILVRCGILLLLAIVGLTCSLTAQYFSAKAAVGYSTGLRHALFEHIQTLSFSEMDTMGTSTLITRMTSDVNQVQSGLNLFLRLFLRSPFVVIGAMIMAFTVNFRAALIFVVAIPLLSIVVFGVMVITRPLYKSVQTRLDRVLGLTRENLTGVRVVRAFDKERSEVDRFEDANELLTQMQLHVGHISALMNPLTYVIINLAIVALLYVGSIEINIGGMASGDVIALVNYMNQILVELVKLANLIVQVSKALACAGRVQAVLDTKPGMEFPAELTGNVPAEKAGDAVRFDHVSLTYKGAGAPSLSDINFTAKRGQTIGVIGGTGSGKSSLISLIPRFYDATEGSVEIMGRPVRQYPRADLRGKVAVVMQKAQLFGGTIRSNLLWGSQNASDADLWAALETAQAAEFVKAKPLGLDEPVEQGGRNLSGGQKQRLTIARALVGKPDILILDDSASALDYATDAALRKALAALPGDLTVFIVSQRAASLQHADQIIVLDDGRMVGLGRHAELLESCPVYKEIYESQFKKGDAQMSAKAKSKLTPEQQKATMTRVLQKIKPYGFFVVCSLIVAAVSVAAQLYIPILCGSAIDMMLGKGAVDHAGVLRIIYEIIVVAVVAAFAQWLLSVCNNRITFAVSRDLRNAAMRKIQTLSLSYLDSHPSGDIVSRMVADVDTFADGLLMGFTQLFSGVLTILGTLLFMLQQNVPITLVVVCITPLSLVVASFLAKRSYKYFQSQSTVRGEQTALVNEMIEGQKVVQAFGHEAQSLEAFDEVNGRLQNVSLKAIFFSSMTNPATRFVNNIVYAGVGLVGAIYAVAGGITIGQLSIFLNYANQYTKPFNEISGVVTELQNALACAARVFELLDAEDQTPEAENAAKLVPDGHVQIEDVSFRYLPDRPLIEGLSLDIKPGQRIAIVGPTGCGKTTLINLLMRFYDVNGGSIKVSGTDIRDVTRASLRGSYGMVLQDTWLRAGTVRENIAYGKPDAPLDEVVAAAKAAHADSFIRRLPEGYDTVIAEDGGNISQGQKQLLCIARVMLCLPPMLILDEATSSIDTRTEVRIQAAFARMMQGRTSFIVAHRLSTIREADVILVMKDGRIVEQGDHDTLLAQGGFYAKLYNSQFEGVET